MVKKFLAVLIKNSTQDFPSRSISCTPKSGPTLWLVLDGRMQENLRSSELFKFWAYTSKALLLFLLLSPAFVKQDQPAGGTETTERERWCASILVVVGSLWEIGHERRKGDNPYHIRSCSLCHQGIVANLRIKICLRNRILEKTPNTHSGIVSKCKTIL
jgi:hypothetical protein